VSNPTAASRSQLEKWRDFLSEQINRLVAAGAIHQLCNDPEIFVESIVAEAQLQQETIEVANPLQQTGNAYAGWLQNLEFALTVDSLSSRPNCPIFADSPGCKVSTWIRTDRLGLDKLIPCRRIRFATALPS